MFLRKPAFVVLTALGVLLTGCPERSGDADQYTRDGNLYLDNGNYSLAEATFDKALRQNPGTAGLLMSRGTARMLQEKYGEAMADYDAALEIDPGFASAYANRGILRDRRGDTEGAIADYRRALDLDPELGKGPSIWKRIISNPSTDTIGGRMRYLLSLQEGAPASP